MVLVGGPFTGPMTQVAVDSNGGVEGTPQLITVLAVVEDPVARTVGFLHVRVCVSILALTFGAMVFCRTGTERTVLHQLELSCTITVHVPGTVVTVEVFPPRMILGVTTPVKLGAKKVYEQVAGGVCVDTGLMILIVVWFRGEHPTEKFVGLLSEKVGKAFREVMVTVFCAVHPFTRFVVTKVYTPGGIFPLKMLMLLLEVAMGTPPGNGLSGLYQSC